MIFKNKEIMNEETKQTELDGLQDQLDTNMTNEQAEAANSEEMTAEADNSTATEESLEQQLAKLNDTHLRLMAEYDNYRKRTLKEKSDLIRNGGEKVLRELLPVVDDLDIALANMDTAEDMEAVKEGIRLIYSKFTDYLSRQGIKPIETAGVSFDEELHEAIATFPAPSEKLKGKVIDCVKKGYTLNDKVLRHSSVVVGQ